jgi:uncharacterized phage protein gp47/JayE/uncharacterized protein YuzE
MAYGDPPTLDEMHEFLLALAGGLFPDLDLSQGSDGWLWHKTQAAGVTDNHAHVDATENDLMPDTAEGDMQDRWGAIRGVQRKGATGARKADALRVFGTALTVVDVGEELTHSSGLRFQTSSSDIIGPDGFVDVDVAALDVGSATRLSKGETLTFLNTPAGLEDNAELQIDLDEDGEDQESAGAYRNRILSRFKNPPLGGAAEDYVQWALENLGVASAYCYPLRRGLGTVDVAFLHAGSGTARVPLAPEIAEVQAVIDTKRPVSVKAFRVLQVEAEAVDVELLVTPDGQPEHEFDWDDSVVPTVTAWDPVTRTLQFNALPASVKPGDRIIFKNPATAGNTGRERVVESLAGGNDVILEVDENGDTPVVGTEIFSGGPLVATVRAAIIGLFDSLGTANPDVKRYGAWDGNLRPGGIFKVANVLEGVLDTELVAPAAMVEAEDPAYPNDESVGVLVYGRVLVRRAH